MNEFRKDILDTQNSLFGPFNDFKAGSDSAYYKIVPCSSSKPMWNQIKKDYTANIKMDIFQNPVYVYFWNLRFNLS